MSKHTPGPWTVESVRSGFYIMSQFDVIVATADPDGRYGTIGNEANARLIAAAPDLLAALKHIISNCRVFCEDSMDIDDGAVYDARAAIAKAKGEQS